VQAVRRVVPVVVSIALSILSGGADFTCHAIRRLLILLARATPRRPAPTRSCVGESVEVSPDVEMFSSESMLVISKSPLQTEIDYAGKA
jgi:hypothetical protein